MMRHIYRDGKTNPPKNIYRIDENGKVIKVKKAWRAISNTEYVKVWNISGDNRLIIEGYCSGYYQFQYTLAWLTYPDYKISVPSVSDVTSCTWSDFTVPNCLAGTIDWGDGTTEQYNSDNNYTHDYYNNASAYFQKNYNQQYGSVYFKITITFDTDIVAIINPSFFNANDGYRYNCITAIHFPDSCKYLPNNMNFDSPYYDDFSITINVPQNMQVMTCYLSGNGRYIENFIIPDTVKYAGLSSYLKNTQNYYNTGCFQSCNGLSTVNIPKGVKMLNDLCFNNCSNLQTVTGLEGVEVIGWDCFHNCVKLKPIIFHEGLKYIFDMALYNVGMDLSTSVELNESGYDYLYLDAQRDNYLTYPFETTTLLDVFYIPDSVEYIGYQVLRSDWWKIISIGNNIKYLCAEFYIQASTPLHDIIYRGTTEEWFKIKFLSQYISFINAGQEGLQNYFNCVLPDQYFYKNSYSIYRIICTDGIIINPYAIGYFSDGTEYNGYGDNCFDENGNAIKEKFLILNQ